MCRLLRREFDNDGKCGIYVRPNVHLHTRTHTRTPTLTCQHAHPHTHTTFINSSGSTLHNTYSEIGTCTYTPCILIIQTKCTPIYTQCAPTCSLLFCILAKLILTISILQTTCTPIYLHPHTHTHTYHTYHIYHHYQIHVWGADTSTSDVNEKWKIALVTSHRGEFNTLCVQMVRCTVWELGSIRGRWSFN